MYEWQNEVLDDVNKRFNMRAVVTSVTAILWYLASYMILAKFCSNEWMITFLAFLPVLIRVAISEEYFERMEADNYRKLNDGTLT